MVDKNAEKNLISRIQTGNFRLFESLIAEYQNGLYIFIWRMVKDQDDARDLCQDTFFKAYTSIRSFKGGSKFSTWLFQIGYRKALDFLKKRKKQYQSLQKMESGTELSPSEKRYETKESEKHIGRILDNLRSDHRAALHLYYKEEKTYSEIASIMKIPINTVKSHIFRGKEAIRKKLSRQGLLTGEAV